MEISHLHIIGIGGTGMSAIARVWHERGLKVTGSDRQMTPLAAALQQAGVRVFVGHKPAYISGADVVLRSSAIPDSNPEVEAALARGIPVVKRSDFLRDLIGPQKTLAIAGTHGKTTTTSMLAWVLDRLGLDPGFIVGGIVTNLGVNARAGNGPYFVIEADEYDRMFLGLSPALAIVTNIEHDHPDCFPTPESFNQAFRDFASLVVQEGILLVCGDDPAARQLLQALPPGRKGLSYGTGPANEFRAAGLKPIPGAGYAFDVFRQSEQLGHVSLKVPGKHNVLNAMAVLAAGTVLGQPFAPMADALGTFQGAGRRFEVLGKAGGVTVIDDYGHHPTEIRVTLEAAKERYPGSPLWVVWQPHTYSRTQTLLAEYARAFHMADHLVVTGIYAAREKRPDGFSMTEVMARLAHPASVHFDELDEAGIYLVENLPSGAVLLTLSAGDAVRISRVVFESLKKNVVNAA